MNTYTSLISIDKVETAYDGRIILNEVSLDVNVNERWAIIGKNGVGKSTLIKTVASLVKSTNGSVIVEGKDISTCHPRKRARLIAYVPQKPDGTIPYTVWDYILLGRYASMGMFSIPSVNDTNIVTESAELCDVTHLFNRMMNTLSGGELQRVLLAGAVAQQTPILLLDEPTTYLDPAHERMFFNALARVHEDCDLTIMMVTHDINTAISYCTHVCGLIDGKIVFKGSVEKFKSKCPALLTELFGIPFVEYCSADAYTAVFGAWGVPC